MDDDQQFCLRWNNHQSTLVSVFDNLLENGALVDCTLFAEGKYLKAHKVVLSACSPYFESLLTQQYDKHPIFILKDVKFQELKAMMDYMYRGEVNISQDQLAALLKAAESLQIKGLSDSRNKSDNESRKAVPPPPPPKTPPPAPTLPRVQGLTIEQRKTPKLSQSQSDMHHEDSMSRDGSISPVPRKRKKPRRRTSQDALNDNHDASNSSESHSNQAPAPNIPSSSALPTGPLASTSKLTVTDVPEPDESKADIITTRQITKKEQSTHPPSTSSSTSDNVTQVPIKEKLETHSELILEPKSEYIEEDMNEDSVEDLTLDDDDVSQMEHEMDHARPGPSHGSTDGSAQGFGAWHMSGNQNQDEVFLAAQEAVGAHRDSQEPDSNPEIITGPKTKSVKLISVENVQDKSMVIGELKKELSTHLTFDRVKIIKKVNKKIIDKELSLSKLPTKPRPVMLHRVCDPSGEQRFFLKQQSIASSRMEKFLTMTAADCVSSKTKQLACLNPILKTPKDTIRCANCDVLYVPAKKSEHLKVCLKTKMAASSFGCLQCSYKSSSQEETAKHVRETHK